MDLRLEIAQKQIITQKMVQSMEILQLNALELMDYLEAQRLDNPVMEIEEVFIKSDEKQVIDTARKLEWLASTDRQNRVYYRDDYSDDSYLEQIADPSDTEETIRDYLHAQLLFDDLTSQERAVLEFLLHSLDERGYLTENICEMAEMIDAEEEILCRMVKKLQSLDPAGVGARDLKECLLLQLNRLENHDETVRAIVENHLEDIGKHHFQKIARAMRISLDEVMECCECIKSLDPKPGSMFSSRDKLRYVTPDAVIVKSEGEFQILINEYTYPHVTINSYYENLAKTTDDADAKKYLKEKIQKVTEMQENLKQRSSTLSRVLHTLVERQKDFFVKGPGHKRPLKLSDISDELNLHESTISRAMSSKYLQCSWGVYPLNYFLTSVATINRDSGREMTQEDVRSKLIEIIENEDKSAPLSDEKISKALKEQNINISRRTVNKYRQILGIPDKNGRKKIL